MMTLLKKVEEFHRAAELPVRDTITEPTEDERELRVKLLLEEFTEYVGGEHEKDMVKIADGLADMMYIIIGTALQYGIPLERVFNEVHRSNMTKFVNGKVLRRGDGKILKPDTYSPARIKETLYG